MSAAARRLMADVRTLRTVDHFGMNATPDRGNIMQWTAVINGPRNTEWEGGVFSAILTFNGQYPFEPPKVHFLEPIPFHPNTAPDGAVCVRGLSDQSTPQNDVLSVLASLIMLLVNPNPDSANNGTARDVLRQDPEEYKRRVRECARRTG